MRVLVTGGAGYLGSVLVPSLLRAGHRVTVVDSLLHGGESLLGVYHEGDFLFVKEDIRSLGNSAGVLDGVEAIVHLAAIVGDPACARQPDLARSVNYEASLGLFDRARRKDVQRFVFASTCSNYGKMTAGSGFLDESSPLRPVSLYAETKVGVEQALLNGHGSNGPAVTVLRCSTLFGLSPRMRFDLTVNEFTKELLVKRKLLIFGKQFWRPYVHVQDVARAIMRVLESPPDRVAGEVYNVGDSGQNYQKGQIVELVRSNLDFDVDIEYVEKAEDPRDYRVAFDKIRDRLGYRISRTVEEGICEVRDAIRQGIFTDCESPRYHN